MSDERKHRKDPRTVCLRINSAGNAKAVPCGDGNINHEVDSWVHLVPCTVTCKEVETAWNKSDLQGKKCCSVNWADLLKRPRT